MKQRNVAMLTFLFFILFTSAVSAQDLFDLDSSPTGTPEGTDETTQSDESAAPAPADQTAAPETQKLAVEDAIANPEAEKELRSLTVEKKKKIKVVQKKEYTKDGRAELGIDLGLIPGSFDYVYGVGAHVGYHFNDYIGLAAKVMYGLATSPTDAKNQIENELRGNVSTSNMQLLAGASVLFTPFYGKLSLMGSFIPKYDITFGLGGYYYQVELKKGEQSETGMDFAVDAGFAARFWLSPDFILGFNCDWFIMKDKRYKAESDGMTSYLKSDFMFSINVGMFLPFAN